MAATGARCPICGAMHAACGGPSGSVPVDAGLKGAWIMAGPVKRVQMKDGSVLLLNAEDEKQMRAQGLVGEPTGQGASRPPGPDDPNVFYDDGSLGDAEPEAKAVEAAPENKAITSAKAKGK